LELSTLFRQKIPKSGDFLVWRVIFGPWPYFYVGQNYSVWEFVRLTLEALDDARVDRARDGQDLERGLLKVRVH
jgi:hypothetical protein